MPSLRFARLFEKRRFRTRTRPTGSKRRFGRSLEFLQLEDRLMLAGLLGTAEGFAILAASTVTNTGPSVITGNVGVSPGTAIVGFPPGTVVSGTIHAADAVAAQAQSDVTIAYNDLAGRASDFDLSGQDLGGLTLTPGVYTFSSSAQLTGTLTLDAQGDPDAEFVFQIGSTLTTASNSFVVLINDADFCNVFYQVGSSATLGTNTSFEGNILALASVTLNTGANILNGRALARTGAVTLDSNLVSADGCGSISWEKRATDGNPVLLGGATFVISPNPQTGIGTLTVVDGGANDADGLANGLLEVDDVRMGTYTITETIAPPGYAVDDDPTRTVTVDGDNYNAVIGVQGVNDIGNTDESDFHNQLIADANGSISWEKRATEANPVLLGGATFVISPNPLTGTGTLTVVDGGANDADGLANGVLRVNNVLMGTFTVTETVAPPGYAIDDDPTRTVVVSAADLNAVIGTQGSNQPGDTDESDFHNIQLSPSSIAWEKRATDTNPLLVGGATFQVSPNPLTGIGTLTVVDGGANDADGLANGTIQVNNVLFGTYTVTETIPPIGYIIDDDPTRVVTVSAADPNAVIGIQGSNQPGNTDESDFHNITLAGLSLFVIGAAKSPLTPQLVQVIDRATGAVITQFAPYGPTFQGGVRVAAGDLTGDGVDEIVTAPGWSITGEVRVYTLSGQLLTSFLPYGPAFDGGVQIAIADVDGDGLNDIITIPTLGPAQVKVFRNVLVAGIPTFDALNPYRNFLAFPSSFIGGGVVAGADMGSTAATNAPFNTTVFDQRAEIVVGSGAGITATVKVFDVSHMPSSTPTTVQPAVGSFTPFSTSSTTFRGGESLSVARVNPDSIPDIVVGAGANGRSMVDVWAWNVSTSATLSSLSANGTGFAAYTDASRNAPVEVAALDTNSDDIADAILTVQGPGGTTNQIRQFDIVSTTPLQVAPGTVVPGTYLGPYYIDTVTNPAPLVAAGPPPALPGDYNLNGVVDAPDYVIWRKTTGQTVEQYSGADGDGSGGVDLGDYDVWRSHFGQMIPPPTGSGSASGELLTAAVAATVAPAVKTDAISAAMPTIPPKYDWNSFPLRRVLHSRRDSGPPRASSVAQAIGRSRGDLLLAATKVTTARLRGEAIDEVARHKSVPDQTNASFKATEMAFDLYNGGRRSKDSFVLAKI